MKKIKSVIFVSVLILILLPLRVVYGQEHVVFDFTDFPVQTELKGTILNKEPLAYPCRLKMLGNSLVITNCSGADLYNIIDTNTGEITSQFITKGRGPGEMLFPDYIQLLENDQVLCTYDPIMRKCNHYSYNKILLNNKNNYLKSNIINDVFVKIPIFTADDQYTCVLYGDFKGYRFAKISKDGTLIRKFGEYPELKRDYPKILADCIFDTFAEPTPGKKKIVMTYKYWDRIEIRDLECKEIIQIIGPKIKLPEVYIKGENVSPTNVVQCYSDISTGPRGFMVLYYGLSEPEKPGLAEFYRYVLYFDYNGTPLARYDLYPGVKNIAVDWDNRIIYGINLEMEPELYKYKF